MRLSDETSDEGFETESSLRRSGKGSGGFHISLPGKASPPKIYVCPVCGLKELDVGFSVPRCSDHGTEMVEASEPPPATPEDEPPSSEAN